MTRCARTGREQPQQNLRLLDHLVSAGEQPRRQLQSERLRGDPVHDEIELGRLFYGSDVAACSRASQYRNSRSKGVRLITVEWGMPVEKIDTLVEGGGQAGIAMSEHLRVNGVPHLVLERHRVAERWRSARWDSLVMNGPAWHDRFPGLTFGESTRALRQTIFHLRTPLQTIWWL